MMTETEPRFSPRQRVDPETIRDWEARGFRTPERLGWILEDRARTMPHRTAVVTGSRSVTFGELQERASAVARTLVARGVRAGDGVCWMLPTDADAIAVASAIWRIGAVSSPIVPIYRAREITDVIEQVHPAAIITSAEVRGRALAEDFDAVLGAEHRPRARLLVSGSSPGWESATAEGSGALPSHVQPAGPADPCLILFTSGTESAPKGAVHTTAALVHELRSCITGWGITFRDRMFMSSPMTHITGLLQGFLIPARVGGASVLMDRWEPAAAVELIERTHATYMAGATPFLRELLQAYASSGADRSSLQQYCCGGAAVPPELIRGADSLGIAAYRAWGMTELPTSTLPNELDPLDARAETDGRLAPGVELRVVDDRGNDLGPDEVGVLHLRAPEMFLGYLQERFNEKVFGPDGWFDTGDVGSLGSDGYVRISGRTKEIINRGGEKFSAREIQEVVTKHPDVEAAAIVAIPGGRLGEQIGAVVVSRAGSITLDELGRFMVAQGAAKQKRPERLVVVDSMPTTSTGKIDTRVVRSLFNRDG